MKKIFAISLLGMLAASAGNALASGEGQSMKHDGMQMQGMQQAAAGQMHHGAGMVNRVDAAHNKINLTHGPIKTLGWPGMTMDFMVKDPALLHGLHAGQKVRFDVVKDGKKYYIVEIKPQK